MTAADESPASPSQLQQELKLAQDIVETVREPMIVLRPDFSVRSANQSFYDTFQVSSGETENSLLYELGNGQWNIPALKTLLEDVLPDNTAFNDFAVEHEFEGIGRRRLVLNARRIDHVQLILLAFEDETERQRADEAVRESEHRFRVLFEEALDPTLLADDDGSLIDTNHAAVHLLGYSREELVGRPIADISGVDAETFRETWEVFLSAGRMRGEYRLRTRQGQLIDVEFSAVANVLPDQHLASLRDISERKQAEEALRTSQGELQRAARLKDELLALISHEFRTPLTSIRGNVDILRRRVAELAPEVTAASLEDMEREARRLQQLVENMLLLARGDTFAGEPEPVLLQRVLPALLASQENRDSSRPVALSLPLDLPPVLAGESFIEQILENLLSNSYQYGRSRTEIEITARVEDADVVLKVKDWGPVLSEEEVAKMFEPFFRRPEDERISGGAGLGLPVSKLLAELIGCSLRATPREGGGLVVTLRLPALGPETPEIQLS